MYRPQVIEDILREWQPKPPRPEQFSVPKCGREEFPALDPPCILTDPRLAIPIDPTVASYLKYSAARRKTFAAWLNFAAPIHARVAAVEAAIKASRWIIEAPGDLDGIRPSTETWGRATELVLAEAQQFYLKTFKEMPAPDLMPCPNGSIDIHWETELFELLVNVPAEITASPTYFGDCRSTGRVTKGKLGDDPKGISELVQLLTRV